MELQKEFNVAVSEKEVITKLSLEAVLQNMGIQVEEDELLAHIKDIRPDYKQDEIDYELFVRIVALTLELKNFTEQDAMLQEGYEQDL